MTLSLGAARNNVNQVCLHAPFGPIFPRRRRAAVLGDSVPPSVRRWTNHGGCRREGLSFFCNYLLRNTAEWRWLSYADICVVSTSSDNMTRIVTSWLWTGSVSDDVPCLLSMSRDHGTTSSGSYLESGNQVAINRTPVLGLNTNLTVSFIPTIRLFLSVKVVAGDPKQTARHRQLLVC